MTSIQRSAGPWFLAGFVIGAGLLGLLPLRALAQIQETAAYTYVTMDLPLTAPKANAYVFMMPTGITNTDTIAAMIYNTAGPSELRAPNGHITIVQCPQGSTTLVRGVNNAGEAVGACYTTTGYRSFVRTRQGNFVWVDYPGALYTEAYAVSDNGQVVGFYYNEAEHDQPNPLGFYGFHYQDGQFHRVCGPQATDIVFPTGVNQAGDVVGGVYADFHDWLYTGRGFLLRAGQWLWLDVTPLSMPGAHDTWARAINNVGQILLNELGNAYLWENGRALSLPPVPGLTGAALYTNGLNDRGEIVGWYAGSILRDGHFQEEYHGVLARPLKGFPQ